MANYIFDELKDLAGKYVDSIDSWKSEEDFEIYSNAFEMADSYKRQFQAVLSSIPNTEEMLDRLSGVYGEEEVYFLTREY